MKPSNESNYVQIDGKPIWYHLASLFSREEKIYFFLDKKIKGQPTLTNVVLDIKYNVRDLIKNIYKHEEPDRLVVIDDSVVFNHKVAQEILELKGNGIFFNPTSFIDKLGLCGIINGGRIENITYGMSKQENGVFQSGNIYVLNQPLLSQFIQTYSSERYSNYVLFEVFNELIKAKHQITPMLDESYKLVSIRSNADLDKVRKIISENTRNINQR